MIMSDAIFDLLQSASDGWHLLEAELGVSREAMGWKIILTVHKIASKPSMN